MVARYYLKEFETLWSDEFKYQTWFQVELAVLSAYESLNFIPQKTGKRIKEKIVINELAIKKIEDKTKHDIFAFITYITNNVNHNDGKWFHYGLTSTDIVDTSQSIILQKVNKIILTYINSLLDTLKINAMRYKDLPTIGRTHGIHAEFTSFGYKFATWYSELKKLVNNFQTTKKWVEVCKLSGSVGNFANISPEIQEKVAKEFFLTSIYDATQVVSRINHSNYLTGLFLISSLCGKIALEMRHLQRTEVNEVFESFDDTQKGSSSMPHKKNPIGFENISGLNRMLKAYAIASYDNILLWHERDISHSSVERYILPDATSTLGYILQRTTNLLKNIEVNYDNIEKNMNILSVKPYSQKLMNYLIQNKDFNRLEAHEIVEKIIGSSDNINEIIINFKNNNIDIQKKDLEKIFNKKAFLKNIDFIYKKIFN